MSLYRKYRPQTFADVYGQDHVITTLENASEQGKLAHAFLFAGSRGTGKTSVARILAKVLMIQNIHDEILQKQIIKGVEDGSIVDLLEIDAASNRGIDDVRDLIEKIQFSHVAASAKVYIIDEVHMLTKEAFNALLKTLEEPPPYAYFILATTELNKIPATIQSRCQVFPFRRIREEDLIRRLQYIVDQEKIVIDREAIRAIAHHVEGGMRDAISLLDQLRSLPKISVKDIEERIGTTGQEYIEALLIALEQEDAETLVENVRKVEEAGIPLDVFVRQILTLVRDGLHEAIKQKLPTDRYTRMLTVLLDAIRDIRIAPVPGLVLEAALLSLCNAAQPKEEREEKHAFFDSVKKKIELPEKQEAKAETTEKQARNEKEEMRAVAQEESSESLENAIIEAPDLTLQNIRKHWNDIVQKTSPASVKMSLKNGLVSGLQDNKVIVSFSSSFHRDKVAQTDGSRAIEDIMHAIFKRQLKLECVTEESRGATVPEEDLVNLAEAAAEIF